MRFNHKVSPLPPTYMPYLKYYSHHLTKYEAYQFPNSLVSFGKFESAAEANIQQFQFYISFMSWKNPGGIYIPRRTFKNSNFESMDELGKFMSQFK